MPEAVYCILGFHAQNAVFFALSVETRMSPMSMYGKPLHHCFRMVHHARQGLPYGFLGAAATKVAGVEGLTPNTCFPTPRDRST